MRTNYCGFIDKQYLGQQVTLFGWAHRRRDHGGLIFIDLRDSHGIVQIVLSPEHSIATQLAIGSDMLMAMDVCVPSTSDHDTAAAKIRAAGLPAALGDRLAHGV